MAAAEQPPQRDLVVIGASAGGVEALCTVVSTIPPDLPAAVLVVLHHPRGGYSALPSILGRCGLLPACAATHGAALRRGRIYVAPPDHHLVVTAPGRMALSRGPSENGLRPAIDPLFRSAARVYGPRAVGVILSGTRDDGAAGMEAIVDRGGLALVQDPADALYPDMPNNALALVPSAVVAKADGLGRLIGEAAYATTPEDDDPGSAEVMLMGQPEVPEPPPVFGCPTCNGGLYEIRDGRTVRYRCRVGHVWSPTSLLDEQDGAMEGALWMALRGLEDKAALARRMAEASRARGNELTAIRFLDKAAEADTAGKVIADLIRRVTPSDPDDTEIPPVPDPDLAE